MRKYQVQLDDGSIKEMSYIGLNHTADGEIYDDIISSYNLYFDNLDEIIVTNDKDGIRYTTLGDITNAYQLLRNEQASRAPRCVNDYLDCIQQAIHFYFGAKSDRKKRLSFYPTEEEVINKGKKRGRISDLGNYKNFALSLERSVVAQNMLMACGIKSFFKISATTINGKVRVHCYNLVYNVDNDKYYICDFSIPSFTNNKITPIICEIPKEVYDLISSPRADVGCSVEVNYSNKINKKDYLITYDAGRDAVYSVEDKTLKTKGGRCKSLTSS